MTGNAAGIQSQVSKFLFFDGAAGNEISFMAILACFL